MTQAVTDQVKGIGKEIRSIAERVINHDLDDDYLNEKLLEDWMDLTALAERLDGELTPEFGDVQETLGEKQVSRRTPRTPVTAEVEGEIIKRYQALERIESIRDDLHIGMGTIYRALAKHRITKRLEARYAQRG